MTDLQAFDGVVTKLYASGLSKREVAAMLRCSEGKVARSMRRSGTQARGNFEAILLKKRRALRAA